MECTLGRGDLLRLAGGTRGATLHCLKGTVWLTVGDGRDYLVHQGDSFRLPAAATALAEALGSAEVRLVAAAVEAAGAGPLVTLEACRWLS